MDFLEFNFVFLRKKADFRFTDEETKKISYKGHFEFQKQKMLEKKLLFSGPLDGTGGLYFFSSKLPKDELENELMNDPLIKIGLFIPEVHKFYLPSFMIKVLEADNKTIIDFFTEVSG